MLTNKDDLTVNELKRFLRAHITDKNTTEPFQEPTAVFVQNHGFKAASVF